MLSLLQVAAATGDSLVRLLLNVAPLQGELAGALLERVTQFQSGDEGECAVARLILGQFRW